MKTFAHPGFEITKENDYGSIKIWLLSKERK